MSAYRVLVTTCVVIFASILGVLLAWDQGYVQIRYHGWVLDTSLWAVILAIVVIAIVWHYLFKIVRILLRGESNLANWVSSRRLNQANLQTSQAIEAETNGDLVEAIRLLAAAGAHSQTPGLHYLRASELAKQIGANEQAEEMLNKAGQQIGEHAGSFIAFRQAKQLIDAGESKTGLSQMRRVLEKHPQCAPALRYLIQDGIDRENWVSTLEYVAILGRLPSSNEAEIREMSIKCWIGRLQSTAPDSLLKVWKLVPKKLRANEDLLAGYVEALIASHRFTDAAKLVEQAVKRQWSSRLVSLYAQIDSDTDRQIQTAQIWLESRDDAFVHLTLARLHRKRNQLTLARKHLLSSIERNGGFDAQLELAEVNLLLSKLDHAG